MSVFKKLLHNHLAKKLDPALLHEHLEAILVGAQKVEPTYIGAIKVSCVQRQIIPVRDGAEYAHRLHSFVKEAAMAGSQLVVFPEYNFFDLLGLIPGFTLINRRLNRQAKAEVHRNTEGNRDDGGTNPALYNLFALIAEPTAIAICTICQELAKAYGIYIYTGSYLWPEDGKLYNAGSLIGRDGKIIGTQKKLHLTDFEAQLGFCRESSLAVYELDFGRVAIPVCMDATYFETFQLARNQGADIVLMPIANNEEYNQWRALRGIWPRVQESYVYGLKSSLNGWLAGMHFTGKAGVFAPIEITPNQDGLLGISKDYEGDSLVTGEINLQILTKARQDAEYYGDSNPAFEADYYRKTYEVGGR